MLIYGSYGYSGNLIVKRAVERGLKPVLAGRDGARLRAQGEAFGLPIKGFSLHDPHIVAEQLRGHSVVLNCAGPFSHTAAQIFQGCLQVGAHYLDITGEIDQFEAFAQRGEEAKAAGVMVMPGVGFDVVPTDCLALHLKHRLPDATHLTLGYKMFGTGSSRGTTNTGIEGFYKGGRVREGGTLKQVPGGWKVRAIDFGRGPTRALLLPWGDVATAWYTTGIPNIEVYSGSHTPLRPLMIASRYLKWFFGAKWVQALMKWLVKRMPPGPSKSQLKNGGSIVWGEVVDEKGYRASARMTCPEPYYLTALTAVAIAEKVLAGNAPPGFQTPAGVYGPDLILEMEGVSREDLP